MRNKVFLLPLIRLKTLIFQNTCISTSLSKITKNDFKHVQISQIPKFPKYLYEYLNDILNKIPLRSKKTGRFEKLL